MIRFTRTLCISTAVLTTYACAVFGQQKGAPKVILNARVADGTGKPLRKANVRIIGDLLVDVGNFQPRKEEQVIEAKGLVLAPGFIDIHNHSTGGLRIARWQNPRSPKVSPRLCSARMENHLGPWLLG